MKDQLNLNHRKLCQYYFSTKRVLQSIHFHANNETFFKLHFRYFIGPTIGNQMNASIAITVHVGLPITKP